MFGLRIQIYCMYNYSINTVTTRTYDLYYPKFSMSSISALKTGHSHFEYRFLGWQPVDPRGTLREWTEERKREGSKI